MKNNAIIEISNPNSNSETKTSSQRRIAASRANGARSHGPVTPAGKARSSKNAIKHSILADRATLTQEDEKRFKQMYEAYAERFQPRDAVEYDLVEEFAFCKFQMRVAWAAETDTINLQMLKDEKDVAKQWNNLNFDQRKVLAIQASLEKGNTIALMQRYVRSLSTQANRALKTLMDLRKQPLPTLDCPGETKERNELPTDHYFSPRINNFPPLSPDFA